MMEKKTTRLRRAKKLRAKLSNQGAVRLSVHRTPKHIYAQLIDQSGANILASSSTVQADIKKQVSATGNKEAAKVVGKAIAEKAKAAGIEKVAFDRSGFKYHGRVLELADAARENGLKF
ncbi:50S ribosomal protein L18 [Thiomicrospira sp. WB1]|nr:50S ribosomal protein L18 [Thiomicrospira sp. WB1]